MNILKIKAKGYWQWVYLGTKSLGYISEQKPYYFTPSSDHIQEYSPNLLLDIAILLEQLNNKV